MDRTQIRCRQLVNAMPMCATMAIDICFRTCFAVAQRVVGAGRTCW